MTRDTLGDAAITDAAEFEAALATVVENAVEAGVDVRGAWAFETDGSHHNWEVEIVELAMELEDAED